MKTKDFQNFITRDDVIFEFWFQGSICSKSIGDSGKNIKEPVQRDPGGEIGGQSRNMKLSRRRPIFIFDFNCLNPRLISCLSTLKIVGGGYFLFLR